MCLESHQNSARKPLAPKHGSGLGAAQGEAFKELADSFQAVLKQVAGFMIDLRKSGYEGKRQSKTL